MSGDRSPEKELFAAARKLPEAERAAFLSEACGDDAALRARVEALLAALGDTGERTDQTSAPEESPGAIIDRYKLLQQIGEGGFGTVWMAEQTEPVRRKVALKVIKLGMDTKQVVARFEAERQALALMDHPNIAKVLDGGATPGGRPYFVMELVRGIPITDYCDRSNLTTRERLMLFQKVCLAVQHAHQKGVIHRDLKPSNILVTLHDGAAVPKVIDFGVAKATSSELTQRTLFTEFRQMVGTPEYMAPEQAELSGLDVDTRADVYGLGVLLYELLTGLLPFDSRSLMAQGYFEMLRVIREEEPPKPSTRVSTLGGEMSAAAARRDSTPRGLGRLLRGDLDWIVMRALEKDRNRRYATASDFAADIARHLDDQPVQAGPPSAAYRLRKYVRRHRAGVTAAAAVAVALVAGLLVATWGLLEARDQRDRAFEAEGGARTEAARANTVIEMVEEMLGSADPAEARGTDYTVRELLDDFDRELGDQLEDQPSVDATIHWLLGRTYLSLGALDQADRHLDSALALHRELGDDKSGAVVSIQLARAALLAKRADFGESLRLLDQVKELAVEVFGPRHAKVAQTLIDQARVLRQVSRLPESVAVGEEALEMARALDDGTTPLVATAMRTLAFTLVMRHELDRAEQLQQDALERLRALRGGVHPDVAAVLGELAATQYERGKYEDAAKRRREALGIREGLQGVDHLDYALGLNGLAQALLATGDLEEAEKACRQAKEIRENKLGTDNALYVNCVGLLAAILYEQGELVESEELRSEAVELRRKFVAEKRGSPADLAHGLFQLSTVQQALGKYEEAEVSARKSLEIRRTIFRPGNPAIANSIGALAAALLGLERYPEAVQLRREAVELRRKSQPTHRNLLIGLAGLAEALELSGDPDSTEDALDDLVETARRHHSRADVVETLCRLAAFQARQARFAEAETTARDALESSAALPSSAANLRGRAWSVLGAALTGLERFPEAEEFLLDAYTNQRDTEPDATVKRVTLQRLVALYRAKGDTADVERWREELERLDDR